MAEKRKTTRTTKSTTARKKAVKQTSPSMWKERISDNVSDYFRFGESYTSLILGILVVVITSILLLSIVHNKNVKQIQETSSTKTENPITSLKQTQKTYTVQKGDTLWSIAEKEYKSGYNWVDIAKANNLTNPGMINAGNKLIIPAVTPKMIASAEVSPTPVQASPTVAPVNNSQQTAVTVKITGKTYTVQKGDYLWEIAVRAYGDGYKWVDIAKANNLSNPGLIFSGNVLSIPR